MKSVLSHKNKFARKSCQKCGLSPFFHWCLQLSHAIESVAKWS